eukprot:225836_1
MSDAIHKNWMVQNVNIMEQNVTKMKPKRPSSDAPKTFPNIPPPPIAVESMFMVAPTRAVLDDRQLPWFTVGESLCDNRRSVISTSVVGSECIGSIILVR